MNNLNLNNLMVGELYKLFGGDLNFSYSYYLAPGKEAWIPNYHDPINYNVVVYLGFKTDRIGKIYFVLVKNKIKVIQEYTASKLVLTTSMQ